MLLFNNTTRFALDVMTKVYGHERPITKTVVVVVVLVVVIVVVAAEVAATVAVAVAVVNFISNSQYKRMKSYLV